MIRLEVRNENDEVQQAFNLEMESGGTVSVSGFHGTSVYEVTQFDRVLTVKFTGVTEVSDAPKEIKAEQQKDEEGNVVESEAEAQARVMAEEEAKKNDEKAAKENPPAKKAAAPSVAPAEKSAKS